MYQGVDEELGPLGADFQALVTDLAQAQVEFDLGSEDIIARHGVVEGGRFHVGERDYHVVVLPPHMENVNARTLALLEQFLQAGGVVIHGGDAPPVRVDGQVDDRPKALATLRGLEAGRTRGASLRPFSPIRGSGSAFAAAKAIGASSITTAAPFPRAI